MGQVERRRSMSVVPVVPSIQWRSGGRQRDTLRLRKTPELADVWKLVFVVGSSCRNLKVASSNKAP